MGDKFCKFILRFDAFGHPIAVHYDGEDRYKTRFGAVVSLVVLALIIFNLANLASVFMDGSR